MDNAATVQPLFVARPGTTASGIASASQLVELTPFATLRVDMTASPQRLVVFMPPPEYGEILGPSPQTALAAAKYPVLAEIWDNDEDDIFDTV